LQLYTQSNHVQIWENLHGRVKKTAVAKYLAQLTETKQLSELKFGKVRLYVAPQTGGDEVTPQMLDALDVQIATLAAAAAEATAADTALSSEVRLLAATPTDAEMTTQLAAIAGAIAAKEAKLSAAIVAAGTVVSSLFLLLNACLP
jgi:hypothetical protein